MRRISAAVSALILVAGAGFYLSQPEPEPEPKNSWPALFWEAPRSTPSVASRSRAVRPSTAPSPAPLTLTGTVRLDVTCYCWSGNRTASGVWPKPGMAASNRYLFGTRLHVEGVGVVTVTDRIGHGSELDLFFASRSACLKFGRRSLHVAVVR